MDINLLMAGPYLLNCQMLLLTFRLLERSFL